MNGIDGATATPLEYYRFLRERLLDSQGEEPASPSLRTLFATPFAKSFQLSRALRRLANLDQDTSPLIPIQYPSGAAPLTDWWGNPEDQFPAVMENCQLALLWALLGRTNPVFQEAAKKLAGWLEPIVAAGLLTLWSKESTFKEDESVPLFLRALGKKLDMERPTHPFYAWIYDQNPKIESTEPVLKDVSLGYHLYPSDAPLALTASGKRTAAGALKIQSWSIPAFGPQGDPLSDAALFGVNSAGNGENWFSSVAQPEAWFRVLPEKKEKGWLLQVDSVGLSAHRPLSFAFYVTGDACSIPGRTFKPGSLQRYIGEGAQIIIEQGKEKFLIAADGTMKLEIVPLAGGEGFWGASFLIAFWLPPFLGSYRFEIVAK